MLIFGKWFHVFHERSYPNKVIIDRFRDLLRAVQFLYTKLLTNENLKLRTTEKSVVIILKLE